MWLTGGTANPTSGIMGTSVTLTVGTAPQGKKFKEWRIVSGNVTIANNTFTIGTANVIIEAVWENIIYTITYHLDGGTNHPSNPSNYTIESVTITLQSPTRQNYKFDGWFDFDVFDYGGHHITSIPSGSTGDITLWATWTQITSSSELFAPNLKIYPNPFTDAVRITGAVSVGAGLAPAQQTGRGQAVPLRITNAAGMVVHTQMLTGDDETLRLEYLPTGVYFFRVEKDGKAKTEKVVKD